MKKQFIVSLSFVSSWFLTAYAVAGYGIGG